MRRVFGCFLVAVAACGDGGSAKAVDAGVDATPIFEALIPGTRPLGAAVVATTATMDGPRYRVTLAVTETPADMRLAVKRRAGDAFLAPIIDPTIDGARVTISVEEEVTVQLVAGPAPVTPAPLYRAIAGVSMGGGAAAGIGLRAPDRWDLVADLGGEPGPSTLYSLNMIAEYLFGGFCPSGGICLDTQRPQHAGQYELRSDYEHFVYQAGAGVGLTLDRDLYAKATRDLARALGNPAVYNADDAYLPPGVPRSWLSQADRCTKPIVLQRFFDRRFNPDGSLPVITFCDGADGGRLGPGVFDDQAPQTNPVDVLLAVDRNKNGRRDSGEPVIAQPGEPFADVGRDGIPSTMEPGYDPVTNPDPAGDDWHPLRNAAGSEKNGIRDEGEPFEDVGVDGVAGTCQIPTPGCYDAGEGDGKWTTSPSLARWLANDAGLNLAKLGAEQRGRLAIYYDAGIRDFLNSHVATSSAVGAMAALGMPVTMWNGFPRLSGATSEPTYDFEKVPWSKMSPNVFVRYGNPDATQAQIEQGDGRHVGTPQQLVMRLTTLFGWLDARWPNGDRERAEIGPDSFLKDQHFTSPTTGRDTPYAVFLPPGYQTGDKRYPAMFFQHGYGMSPDDLLGPVGLLSTYMAEGRLQKMIVVFVDGRCRAGDGCETGTFFADSPVSAQAQMETHLYELRAEIERRYRLK